jgi:hypothetical protein
MKTTIKILSMACVLTFVFTSNANMPSTYCQDDPLAPNWGYCTLVDEISANQECVASPTMHTCDGAG